MNCNRIRLLHFFTPLALSVALIGGCSRTGDELALSELAAHGAPAKKPATVPSLDNPTVARVQDVVYGRKHGMALTMDVFTPRQARSGAGPGGAKPNGAAVIWLVSGAWFSSHDSISIELSRAVILGLTGRGYTVFAVVHSSQPHYNIPEILPDVQRAVRYIRYHAKEYGINPQCIGITGASSGGHLALMQAVAGEAGDVTAVDDVEKVSSRVQAVACFFPPTDFLNYGKPGESALGRGRLKEFPAPFDFGEANPKVVKEIGRQISPVTHASADDPPTLIIHGDKDALVPIQQAKVMIAALQRHSVPAQLIVKRGAEHGWPDLQRDMPTIANWFDKYLLSKSKP